MECDITTLPEQIKLKASVHQQYEYSKRRWDAGYFGFTQKKEGERNSTMRTTLHQWNILNRKSWRWALSITQMNLKDQAS